MMHLSCPRPQPSHGAPQRACLSWTPECEKTQGPATSLPSEVWAPPPGKGLRLVESWLWEEEGASGWRTGKAAAETSACSGTAGSGEQHWFPPHFYTTSENMSTHLARLAFQAPLLLPA